MVALGLATGTSRQWSWAEYGHSHPAILRGWLALNELVSKKHHDLIFAGTKHHPRKMNLKYSFGTCSCGVLVAQNLCTSTQPIPGFHPHRPIERLCSNNSRIDARKILTCLGKRTQKFVWGGWAIAMTNLGHDQFNFKKISPYSFWTILRSVKVQIKNQFQSRDGEKRILMKSWSPWSPSKMAR